MDLKVGTHVIIADKLHGTTTHSLHHLDPHGYMLGMEGKVFPIEFMNRTSVRIANPVSGKSYTFSKEDISIYSEEPQPKEFKFNEQFLDTK